MATVHVSATTTDQKDGVVRFDSSYIKTIPGLLKIGEAVVSLIGFICIQSMAFSTYRSAGGWYCFVAMTGFWISLLLVVFYLFHIVEKLQWLPWLIVEAGFSAAWTVCFFIAACVAAAHGNADAGWGAAAFFGFLAMFIFGYEAFRKYKSWKSGEVAQGEKTMSNADTSSPTGPSYPTY